jgi:hypothetical protein
MKKIVFFLSSLLIVGGCRQVIQTPSSSSVQPTYSTPSPVNMVVTKPLPSLGSLVEGSRFDYEDSKAIISGSPRPTSPPILAVLAGNPPTGTDVCNLPYSALIMAMYQQCIKEGMSYVEVANIIGFNGEENSSSGSTVTYTWSNGEKGIMTAVFQNNKLSSKAQTGLK